MKSEKSLIPRASQLGYEHSYVEEPLRNPVLKLSRSDALVACQLRFMPLVSFTVTTRKSHLLDGASSLNLSPVSSPPTLHAFVLTRGLVHGFTYDNWLRVATNTVGTSGTPAYVKKEMLAYDVRGLLNQLRETTNTGVSEILRDYDGQAHLVSEEVRLGANVGSLAAVTKLVNHYDAAGRRDSLGKDATIPSLGSAVGGNWGFGYRADGHLTSVSSAGASFNYSYGDNGLLQTRSNAFRNYTVPTSGGRDNRGRLLSSGTLLTGQSVNVVTESLSWTVDSRQATYTAARRVDPNTAGNTTTWNDARSYLYTTQRRQLASESWVPGAGQVAKTEVHEQDMGQTGGLGVHTGSQVAAPPGSSGNQVWQVNASNGQDAFSRVKSETSGYETIGLNAQGTALGAKDVTLTVNQTTGLLNAPMQFVRPFIRKDLRSFP